MVVPLTMHSAQLGHEIYSEDTCLFHNDIHTAYKGMLYCGVFYIL